MLSSIVTTASNSLSFRVRGGAKNNRRGTNCVGALESAGRFAAWTTMP